MDFPVGVTMPQILCCMCGTSIYPNPANMCVNCIRGRVDITEGIPKKCTVYYCRGCDRYLQPPKYWVAAELESKQLLGLLVKRLRGLGKVKLIDAGFKWTEPHSRRIVIRLTIQKEVFSNAILQEEFLVEFTVLYQQCEDCRRDAAKMDAWQAVVQVRQKVEHKKSFLYLEQLILKHSAHEEALGIKQLTDGIDFYFLTKSSALKFISFLQQVMPIRHKQSEHLVTHDPKSNNFRYKYTFSVDIAPVCKDDIVCLPPKLSASLGGLGPITIVTRISQSIFVTDPVTLRSAEIAANVYFRYEFSAIMSSRQLVEYTILDVESTGERNGKFSGAEITAAKSSDFGSNDKVVFTKSHLGNILTAGDLALGYDVQNANFNEALLSGYRNLQLPDVVLVKKTYSVRNRNRRRKWKLRRMDMETEEMDVRKGNKDEMDREQFLRDLEADQELRSGINLYKDPTAADAMTDVSDVDEHAPEIPIEELLDGLNIEDEADDDEISNEKSAEVPLNA